MRDHDIVRIDARFFGDIGVMNEVAIFAVNRDEELRLRQLDHPLELGPRGVTGDVNVVHGLVKNFGALLEEIIDHPADGFFVAGNELRAHQNEIAVAELDVRMLAHGDADQRGAMLALASRRKHDDFVAGILLACSRRESRADADP